MSVTLFIQDRSGNYNFYFECPTKEVARNLLKFFIEQGGYWTLNDSVFIPWHRVDFAEVRE